MTDEEKSKELISKIHHSSKVEKKHFKAWNGRPKPHHTTSIDPDRLWQNRNVAYSNIPRWDAYNLTSRNIYAKLGQKFSDQRIPQQ